MAVHHFFYTFFQQLPLCRSYFVQTMKKSRSMSGRVIQKYLERPYLVYPATAAQARTDPAERLGHKFDIRQWVLLVVTQEGQLECYIWGTYYVRICSMPFLLKGDGWRDARRHFSNIKVNEGEGMENCWGEERFLEEVVTKKGTRNKTGRAQRASASDSVAALKERLRGGIREGVRKAVKRVAGELDLEEGGRLEVLGFDFLVDEELRPWLCEVNESPGLRRVRGGEDVSDEVETMCEEAWRLTIGRWFVSSTGASANASDDADAGARSTEIGISRRHAHPHPSWRWVKLDDCGEVEMEAISREWGKERGAGRELGVDGSALLVEGRAVCASRIAAIDKLVEGPEAAIIIIRTFETYLLKFRRRRTLALLLQRRRRGQMGRRRARATKRKKCSSAIARFLRRAAYELCRKRVLRGAKAFQVTHERMLLGRAFMHAKLELEVERSLKSCVAHMVRSGAFQAVFRGFHSWRCKIRSQRRVRWAVEGETKGLASR